MRLFGSRAAAQPPQVTQPPQATRVAVPALPRPGNLQTATITYPYAAASRETALTIPTVSACRDLIVGAAVQMGIGRHRGGERIEPGPLLTQPDPDTTWTAVLAGTVDDLLFYGRAYWYVLAHDGEGTEANPQGFPVRARWIPYGSVTPEVDEDTGAYARLEGYRVEGLDGVVPPEYVIRFDSPLPGVLAFGARTIAGALAIENAARRFAEIELPAGVLQNEGTELGPDEAQELVDGFQASRQANTIAFLQSVTYERTDINAEDMQLIEARALAATECARLFNVPVAMVSASPSGNSASLLYQNLAQQLAVFVSNAVAPHLRTVEGTLSLPSVTPRGQRVSFDVQAFLRTDPQAAATYALDLYAADLVDRNEARAFLGIPATPNGPELEPGRV